MLQIMSKAECLYILLKTWGDLALISPVAAICKLMCETGVDALDLSQLGKAAFRSTGV